MKILIPKNPVTNSSSHSHSSNKVVMDSGSRKFENFQKLEHQLPSFRREPDPYVFSEPDIYHSNIVSGGGGGKDIKLIAPSKNSKLPLQNKSRCVSLMKHHHEQQQRRIQQRKKFGVPQETEWKRKHLENLKQLTSGQARRRDHSLLYYPRAGDEIRDNSDSDDVLLSKPCYQQHWFEDGLDSSDLSRSARLQLLHLQLQRQLIQLQIDDKQTRSRLKRKAGILIEAALQDPTTTARALSNCENLTKSPDGPLIVGGPCRTEGCLQISLPCTQHCSRHIMLNVDQLLFEHCTAKFSDNTQCAVPVFDVAHELPLCPEHARKRDNYHRKILESKPKKPRKRPTSPIATVISPLQVTKVPIPSKSKSLVKTRPKKKKKPPVTPLLLSPKLQEVDIEEAVEADMQEMIKLPELTIGDEEHRFVDTIVENDSHNKTLTNLNMSQASSTSLNSLGLDLGPLGLSAALKEEVGEVFEVLDPSEHDFGNVLNNLPADAFNDLFIENRNGDYEPSREEEEELERALEAVNKDVRNLERIGQSHGLLEPSLLAQIMSDIAS